MDRQEFGQLIGDICRYWERRPPSATPRSGENKSDLDAWYETVSWIPAGYGKRIFQRFTGMTNRPGNIPLLIKQIFKDMADYTKRDPERIVGCDQCEEGILWMISPKKAHVQFRCGNCQARRNDESIPMALRSALEDKGFQIEWIHKLPRGGKAAHRPKLITENKNEERGKMEPVGELLEPYYGEF
jgi:hypothetical protein